VTQKDERWRRETVPWSAGAVLFVAGPLLYVLANDEPGWRKVAAALIAGALVVALLHRPRSTRRCVVSAAVIVHLVALVSLWAGLALLSPAFFIALGAVYPGIFVVARFRAAAVCATVLAAVDLAIQLHQHSGPLGLLSAIVGPAAGLPIAWWIVAIAEQSEQRRRMIDRLSTRLQPWNATSAADSSSVLTRRELEIVRELARGGTNAQIAQRLFISEHTVKTHLLHVFVKLEVQDRLTAVARARHLQLI
jgi:DNA-binding CsgD family transcriptional regulator